jgi:signal transduction histidine kinase/putative methionine-R-sulfoxide reductase with GAF domain/ActR/RegA family two-component response regulator
MSKSTSDQGKIPRHEILRLEALALLKSFTNDIVGIQDTEELLWAVAEKAISKLGWQDCVIYIKDDIRNLLIQKAAFGAKSAGNHSIIGPIEIPVGKGIVGKVASTGQSIRIGNTALIKDYIIDDEARLSELAVPIISNNKVIGVIDSEHQDADFFQIEDQLILETLAGITATKFENSKKTKSNESLALFYKSNPNPVLQIDLGGTILYINNTAKEHLQGCYENGTLQMPGLEAALNSAVEKGHALWQSSIGDSTPDPHAAGTARTIKPRVTEFHVVRLPTGLFNLYGHDISHILDLKQQAESANEAKSRFLSVMSHEIRTPLNAILGLTDLLIHDNPNHRQRIQHLAYMEFSGKHLLSLVNDILDIEKIASKKVTAIPTLFNLKNLIQNIKESFQTRTDTTGLDWSVTLEPGLPDTIFADAKWITQILNNLISNAIKYTEQGHIKLIVSLAPELQTPEAPVLQFSVHDSGRGIPTEDIERILRPFEQIQFDPNIEGTGLGLAIVSGLVGKMNGELKIRSEENIGSVFTVTVPISISEPSAEDAAFDGPEEFLDHADDAKKTGAKKTIVPSKDVIDPDRVSTDNKAPQVHHILLADDNELNRFVACKLLNRWGYEVHEASDGNEAVALWKMLRPCLILMDIQMPALDGVDACKQIRTEEAALSLPKSPIIALTADAEEATLARIMSAGMDNRIIKPFDPPALHVLIQETLRVFNRVG